MIFTLVILKFDEFNKPGERFLYTYLLHSIEYNVFLLVEVLQLAALK